MAITSITMDVSSIVSNDDFTILTFVCSGAEGTVGQLTYGEGFENYVWVQNEKLTTEGIAVHPYGALIIPATKLATVGVKELELVSDGVSGKPDSESETMLSGLEVGSSVVFEFE